MLLVLECISLMYLATFSRRWYLYNKLSLSGFYMFFALYRSTNDGSSWPPKGMVCLQCHWPFTAPSTAIVLTASFGSYLHRAFDRALNWAVLVPSSCSRRAPIVLPPLRSNKSHNNTRHSSLKRTTKSGFGHYAPLPFTFCMLVINTWQLKWGMKEI